MQYMFVCVNNSRREKAVAQSLVWSFSCQWPASQGNEAPAVSNISKDIKLQWANLRDYLEITLTSPQENHHCLSASQDMEPSEMQHILKEEGEMIKATWRGEGSLALSLRGGSVWLLGAPWRLKIGGNREETDTQDDWRIRKPKSKTRKTEQWQPDAPRLLLRSCSLDWQNNTRGIHRSSGSTCVLPPEWMAFRRAHPTALQTEAWGQAERSLLIWSSTLDPDSPCSCPSWVFL